MDMKGRKGLTSPNPTQTHSRTTDEDGKSNIWAYEAKEEVEVTKNSGIVVVGLILLLFVGALSFLPQLQFPSYD